MTDYQEFFIPDDVVDAYNNAEVSEPLEGDLPDGNYSMVIEKVKTKVSKKKGTPILNWQLRILGPKYRGTRVWKDSFLTTGGVEFLKSEIAATGVYLPDLQDLPDMLFEFQGRVVEVKAVTKGEYQNLNIVKLLAEDLDAWADNTPVTTSAQDKDIPF